MKTENGYADIGGAKLYYEIAGTGETLVLSHAGFLDSHMWDDQFEAFAGHYRVIRYDMRGFGRSDKAMGPVSRRADFAALLDALGVERAHLLGCSMSGEVTLDFALEQPERASSLILVSATPSGFQLQGEPPPHLFEMMGALQQGEIERGSELQLRIWVDGMYRQPEQVDPVVRRCASEMNRIAVGNGTFFIADSQPVAPLDPPAVTRLESVHAPTLIVAGALDHPEVRRAADEMAAHIPGAQKVILPDGAHVPNMDQPDAFNQSVLDFLRAL